jgi:FkbM family methyltransferase
MLVVPNEVFGETPVGKAIAGYLRAGDTFIDVGANHGAYSVVAASIVGSAGAVFAFEPQPHLARLVEASLSETFEGRLGVYAVACGATSATVQLLAPDGSSGEAGIFRGFSGSGRHRSYPVPLERIDGLLADRKLPGRVLVKLDVEGSEYAALMGAERLVEELRPILILEVNPRSMRAAGFTIGDLRTWLMDHGYRWFRQLRSDSRYRSLGLLDAGVQGNVVVGASLAEAGT